MCLRLPLTIPALQIAHGKLRVSRGSGAFGNYRHAIGTTANMRAGRIDAVRVGNSSAGRAKHECLQVALRRVGRSNMAEAPLHKRMLGCTRKCGVGGVPDHRDVPYRTVGGNREAELYTLGFISARREWIIGRNPV